MIFIAAVRIPYRGESTDISVLYIVATPIGNLADFSPRAQEVLKQVQLIAAEDTRHSRRLLDAFGISTKVISLHQHNERSRSETLIEQLKNGDSIAIISDAGTPLISDPGQPLVELAHANGIQVVPVPGCCAVITALSAAGFSDTSFSFEGFLPSKGGERRKRLATFVNSPSTTVIYEAPHRIVATLNDMRDTFGPDREACVAREITKTFEQIVRAPLSGICEWVSADSNHQRGEFVICIKGNPSPSSQSALDAETVMRALLTELPPRKAAKLAASLTGADSKELYKLAHSD
jgi:16S rRNA (cytidine1402-2'-O)-methyltransferase